MAIVSKILDRDDFDKKQLTIAETFEPFPKAKRDRAMKVKDEQGSIWKFEYKVESKGTRVIRVISGYYWERFLDNNGVQPGHRVDIHPKDSWCNEADYNIVVIKTGF